MTTTEQAVDQNDTQVRDAELFAAFIDAIGRPIVDLKIKIESGSDVLELQTDQNGTIPVINLGNGKSEGKICALLPTGKEEPVLKFELSLGLNSFVCQSPYLLVPGKTFGHNGVPTPLVKSEKKSPGETEDKRSKAGNPVKQCTGQDCPNSDNLRLCPNQQYKESILAAAKYGNMIPQGVAALVNTEAGRIVHEYEKPVLDKMGKPILGKDGQPRTKKVKVATSEWLPTSTNPRSTARGLTQFLIGSWRGQALINGSYLNTEAIKCGYVVEEVKKTRKPGKKKGTTEEVETKKLVIKDDARLLAMRDDPKTAIIVSVDYGMQNFKVLQRHKFKLSEINDSERAKLFYLMHHLGDGDGPKFINNEIGESKAKRLFEDQIGAAAAEKKAAEEKNKSYMLAHRRWLIEFIDRNIVPKNFACDAEKIPAARPMFKLIVDIGGSHSDDFSA